MLQNLISEITLPYPGFSWSITQHIGPVAQHKIMYELLLAAYEFRNNTDYQTKISERLVDKQLLTKNVRSGKPQPWRDYQQVLTELGLIRSTRRLRGNNRSVNLTPIGIMWLDGLIGFSELITTQCLRYQYPNGLKHGISTRMQQDLAENNIRFNGTRTQLETIRNVRIKPGVLILRILLELEALDTFNAYITDRECVRVLMHTQQNVQWPQTFKELMTYRQSNSSLNVPKPNLRHVQEWFRLYNLTDIFEVFDQGRNSKAIRLKGAARTDKQYLYNICNYHEDISSFWLPSSTNVEETVISWFDFFGNPDTPSQWFAPENVRTSEYLDINYPSANFDFDTDDLSILSQDWQPIISLRSVNTEAIKSPLTSNAKLSDENIQQIELGIRQREQNTRLHFEIIQLLARRLLNNGYVVQEDPQSVDILASKEDVEAIFEVKTVTARNIRRHLRLGISQLLEYRYRRQVQTGHKPSGILVLSSRSDLPRWYIDLLDNDLNLSLISQNRQDSFQAHTQNPSIHVSALCD